MSYIKENTPSLASHMSELGYETYFLHPNTPNAWNRLKVYTNFGFDNILLRDLDGDDSLTTAIEKKRDYTTDQAVFDRIEQIYSEKDSNTPIFTWAVTIQNHGGYTTESDDFTPNISVEGATSAELNTYLSLMNLTDQAFKNLVEYFKDYDEKTIIVMFGDHQPNDNVVNPLYKLNGNSVYDLSTEETELRYITPYVIWANYDIEEATNVDTSANYLSAQLLQAGGIPCSDYQNYLLELSKEIPVLSNASIMDSNGNSIVDDSTYQDKIDEYKRLAYYRLFDCKFTDD
jgi:phosphoglycerol transferase MdoB-like AlkP superfamily enzyme